MKRKMSNTLGAGLLLLASTLGVSAQAQQVFLHSGEPVVDWKLKPQAEVKGDANTLCNAGYNVSSWVDAVVPGTAFTAYVNAGLEKDPNLCHIHPAW